MGAARKYRPTTSAETATMANSNSTPTVAASSERKRSQICAISVIGLRYSLRLLSLGPFLGFFLR